MSAPFLPPKIPPRPAPAAVDPPMTSAVFFQSRRGAPSLITGRVWVRCGAAGACDAYTGRADAGAYAGYARGSRASTYGSAGTATRSLAYTGRAVWYAAPRESSVTMSPGAAATRGLRSP